MSKLIFLAALISLFAVLACSDDNATPAAQPTLEATVTRVPEATATPIPEEPVAENKELAPLDLDDPQAFLSALSAQEQSCLSSGNLGIAQIGVAMTSTVGSAEGDAILDCLEDVTVLRMFLNEPLTATGELSDETSSCIRQGLGGIDLRPMMKSPGAAAGAIDAQIVGMAGLLTFTACLNDEEWGAASSALELGPRDKSGTDCLLAELGGPTGVAEALLRPDESGLPRDFIGAAAKCGVGFGGMSENVPVDSGSGATGGDTSTEGMGLPPETLYPVAVDDPQAFLSGLSSTEQSCLGDKDIGPQELLQMTGQSPGGSPETAADIVNCLRDDTVLRLFLTTLVGQVEPFSQETSSCIREGFVPIDLRGLLAPAVAGFTPANSLALSMAALNVSVVCMNDEEWETYAPRLGMQPEDREVGGCLFEEFGGPEKLAEAMQEASLGKPEALVSALAACGEETAPSTPTVPTATLVPDATSKPTPTESRARYEFDPPIPVPTLPYWGQSGFFAALEIKDGTSEPITEVTSTNPTALKLWSNGSTWEWQFFGPGGAVIEVRRGGQVVLSHEVQAPSVNHDVHHVMLRATRVNDDWAPFVSIGDGWERNIPLRESPNLKYFEAVVWLDEYTVHLYEFDNSFDPSAGRHQNMSAEQFTAYRENYRVMAFPGLPPSPPDTAWSPERSHFLRDTFKKIASYLVSRYPDSEHHLSYHGHGAAGGRLLEFQMYYEDAGDFLAHWSNELGRPLAAIDMGGPCNKGGYEDLTNFCPYARYYIASDLVQGGYTSDDGDIARYFETYAELQYHRILGESEDLREALVNRVELKRKDFEYSQRNMTKSKWQQAIYLYDCQEFRVFAEAFTAFMNRSNPPFQAREDLLVFLENQRGGSGLIDQFQKVIAHKADNRDFFEWSDNRNGISLPHPVWWTEGRWQLWPAS